MMTYDRKIFENYFFSKLFGHVGDMFGYHHWSFWGHQKKKKKIIKKYVFQKLFIDLWAIIWHHHWVFLARKKYFWKSQQIFSEKKWHIYVSFSGIFKDKYYWKMTECNPMFFRKKNKWETAICICIGKFAKHIEIYQNR